MTVAGRRTPHGRAGLTLVELLISMSVTAFIGLAVAVMLQSAAYGTSTKRDMRRVALRAETLRGRLSDAIRNARAVLASGSNYLVLWLGDTNDNDQVNLSELQLIELVSSNQTLTSYTAALPISSDSTYAANTDFNATAQSAKSGGLLTGVAWATGVSALSITLDNSTPQQARLVTWSVTLTNGVQSEPVTGVAALRYSGTPQ